MGELNQALGHIGNIRRQMARTTEFRGYGPATLAGTGAAALIAAALQTHLVPGLRPYLTLWIATAVLASTVAAWQIHARTRRLHSGLSNEMIRTAIEQFLPAAGAGLLMTIVLVRFVPTVAWILPGLWQVCYAVGVFSSCRFLPRPMFAAGCWYLLTGLVCLSLGDARALAPWTMGLALGAGQFLIAGILWVSTPEAEDEV